MNTALNSTLAMMSEAATLAQSGSGTAGAATMAGATLYHYLVVSAIMFAIGLIGFLTRRNLIIMFLCTELMFQAAGIALIAFSRFHMNHTGETFVIFVLTVAAAEAAMALALVVLLFRRKESLDSTAWIEMKG